MTAHLFAIQSGLPANTPNGTLTTENMLKFDSLTLDRASSIGSESLGGTSRTDSIGSDLLATDLSVLDTSDFFGAPPVKPNDRWRRSTKLVQKGVAFSKDFKTLRDMNGENTIDPIRLTKIKQIGIGAFATVDVCWLANKDSNSPPSKVAVKRLRYECVRHRSDLERFFREASLLQRLRHRSICGYVGVGNFNEEAMEAMSPTLSPADAKAILKSTFMVQEYIVGGSLRDVVVDSMMQARSKAYSDEQACAWMQQIAEGLLYLHTSEPKVMHRDLKLDNILMRELPDGKKEACLADFGMSVLLPSQQKPTDRSSSRHRKRSAGNEASSRKSLHEGTTEWQELAEKVDARLERSDTAMVLESEPQDAEAARTFDLTGKAGSFMYMAPEVYAAQQYNEKADVFSFGCIMHEVFARFVLSTFVIGPTGNPEAARIYASKVAAGYRRPLPKGMPIQLQHLISSCWEQDPQERPSIEEVLQRLDALEGTGIFAASQQSGQNGSCMSCSGCAIM